MYQGSLNIINKKEVMKLKLKEFNKVNAYSKAYEIARREFRDMEMTCAKCNGKLIISPFVKDAYFDKKGIVHFGLDTINYCKNCWK